MEPIKFQPIPMTRVWGGHDLKSMFQAGHISEPVGEYWVLSGHPNGTSAVSEGPFAGKTLVELTAEYPELVLGQSPQDRFPLLIKFLEAREDLSVQIHPSDDYAQAHEGDFGKTEAWYVLEAQGGNVVYGHTFKDRKDYEEAVANGSVKDRLEMRTVQPGNLVFVPSQTMHALLAGTTVIEIQQTSDVTYRVYDWDRVGMDGKPRALHTEKAAEVLTYGASSNREGVVRDYQTLNTGAAGQLERLVTCQYFTIDRLTVHSGEVSLETGRPGNPDILVVASGSGTLLYGESGRMQLEMGTTVLIPSDLTAYRIYADDITVLRTFY